MITSLISLYISSSLEANLPNISKVDSSSKTEISIIKAASNGLSDIIEKESVPLKKPNFISPVIEANSSIAIDIESGQILFEKDPSKRLPTASITKLMTILVILEDNKMDEVVTISNNANLTEGSTMHLHTGEQITVKNLLYGALINSANDAAVALAEHNAGSVSAFVDKMNLRAEELGLTNTHFANPIGLDHPENYSSAYDLAKLGSFIYNSPFIKEGAVIKTMDVSSVSGDYTHKLESTNELLDSYLDIRGLKTGQTTGAGLCLIAIARNSDGHNIVTVVLGSPARFEESKILIDWVFRAYNWNN